MKVEFTILGECVSMKNSRELVHFGKKPALIKSAKAREYERTVGLQIPESARQMLTGRLRISVHAFYATERPDLDCELLYDCMAAKFKRHKGKLIRIAPGEYQYGQGERVLVQKGVYLNDRQLREKHAVHAIDKVNPRCEIVIEPMELQQVPLVLGEPSIEEPEDELDEVPF